MGAAAAVAVLLSAAGCGSLSMAAPAQRRVVIGADLSLSGPDSDAGAVLRDALQLRVKELNEQGAITNGKLVLTIRDNRSDAGTSAENIKAFQRDSDTTAAVTGPCDACLTRTAPLVAAGQLPVISLAAADLPDGTAGAGSPLFKLAPNPADDATTLVDLLVSRHAKHVAVVTDLGPYGQATAAALGRAAASRKLDLADPVAASGSVDSITQKLLYQNIQQSDGTVREPDAVVVVAGPDRAPQLVAGLRAEKYRKTVALSAMAADRLFLRDAKLDGCYLDFPPILAMDDQVASTPEKAAQKQWFDDYTSAYGGYRATSGFAADALQIIAAAVNDGGTDPAKLRAAIETTQLDALSGPVRFTPDNHSGLTPQSLDVLQAANSRWHLAG
ncbi:hypothetical protein GCM10022220_13300 [Actinocatenispora rupis]|uniref:Leucine-binding protein domain-containing protein n=1 Tax=Actinocatenispora rupis TaxID=519421 RepID=A0A8J3NBJ6_9ACTN|nr:hypothetical protein Aru02nite_16210 [Actinocatenispora rupis]